LSALLDKKIEKNAKKRQKCPKMTEKRTPQISIFRFSFIFFQEKEDFFGFLWHGRIKKGLNLPKHGKKRSLNHP
jgi:hypothetical protein